MAYFEGFQKCLKYIDEHIEEEINFDDLYQIASMSKTNFQRFFLFLFDMSLQDYIRRLKLKYAAQKLVNSNMSILEIANLYGYDNQSSFTRACKAEFAKTPKEIRLVNKYTSISPLNIIESMREGRFEVNEKPLVYVREIKNSHVISFDVDCFDAEDVAWKQLRKWANENLKDKVARKYVGVAPIGHHPEGNHEDASEHVKHPYKAMMFLLDEEASTKDFFGKSIEDGPNGLYLVSDVALNVYDDQGFLDIALCMVQASQAFVDFVKKTDTYEFDCGRGIFYEEHIFNDDWFLSGGIPAGFRMWVSVKRK